METTTVAALPDDALADVLRRLPPRGLAGARRVCSAWRRVVDARALLLPYQELLPHSALGVLVDERTHLLSRPCSSPSPSPGIIDGDLVFMPKEDRHHRNEWSVLDHCKGRLLCCDDEYDKSLTGKEENDMYQCHPSMEWPPTPWTLEVFSSRTGRWEKKAFVREGKPAGTMQDILVDPQEPTFYGPRQRYAVYHQGDLYVHCQGYFVARFSLSNNTYQVIQTPACIEKDTRGKPCLGRSDNEVYFGIVHEYQIRIWILSESCGQFEWILRYQDVFVKNAQNYGRPIDPPWMLDDRHEIDEEEDDEGSDDNNNHNDEEEEDNADEGDDENQENKVKNKVEWDSDNDDFITIGGGDEEYCPPDFQILGFHPYKKIVFLLDFLYVAAYHLRSSKIQYLGYSRPKDYRQGNSNGIYETFVYTPCMVRMFDEENAS